MPTTESPAPTPEAPSSKLPEHFYPTLSALPPAFSALLTSYSRIPAPSQISHVTTIRNAAYRSHPYRCLGRFRFLDLDLSNHPLYRSHVLSILEAGAEADEESERPLYLDFGCCLGQDIRQLIQDGVPVERVYGSDILPEFVEAGYELFGDRDRISEDHFLVPADGFDESAGSPLVELEGRVSVLHISAVFHLFGLEQQSKLARRCLRLLSRKQTGRCLILGGQVANVTAGEFPGWDGKVGHAHNAESWGKFWEEAAREVAGGCRVEVGAELRVRKADGEWWDGVGRNKDSAFYEKGFRWMVWWVWVEFGG